MQEIIRLINKKTNVLDFDNLAAELESLIFSYDKISMMRLLSQIGAIPECIERDSSEEKLFSKVSDIVLARVFYFLGFDSTVLKQRGDSADVVIQSRLFDYRLVADAKSFRLSRTAKNQKDFKINALNEWRKNEYADYAVLVVPYYQYPSKTSQIFHQAMIHNVCLLNWELLYLLLKFNVCECKKLDFSRIWDYSRIRAQTTLVSSEKQSFLDELIKFVLEFVVLSYDQWKETLDELRAVLCEIGFADINYLQSEISKMQKLSREEAIRRLIELSQFQNRIETINGFLKRINR